MNYFKDKCIWITGASSGIGREMAIQLSQQSNHLILSARNTEALKAVKESCQHQNIDILPLDLADHDALSTICSSNQRLIQSVDILINNGGVSQRSSSWETDIAVYKKIMDVNFMGSVILTKAVLPTFRTKNSGHIVAMSSVAGKFGVPLRSGYSASKFALHGYYDAMRAELSSSNIDITLVCPGFVNTDISKNALKGDGSQHGKLDQAQEEGLTVEEMVKKTLVKIAQRTDEFVIGGFYKAHLATWLSRITPKIFKRIIAKSKVT